MASRTEPPTTYAAWPCPHNRSITARTESGGRMSAMTASRYARAMDPDSIARVATGAANVVTDGEGRVLLVHHTYGPLNWELPGGLGEANETPAENAARELREETGLIAGSLT